MRPARVYKVKIRENILRQMLFTDKNILIIILLIIGVITYLITTSIGLPIEGRVFSILTVSGFVLLILTAKVDRQPTYVIFKRAMLFFSRKRTIRI